MDLENVASSLESGAQLGGVYRGTSLTRKRTPLGPYSRPMPRVVWVSQGGGRFLMGEIPLKGFLCPDGIRGPEQFGGVHAV